MRLLEAIVQANHRALAGDPKAGLRPEDYADSLPLIALTCIDPRLNRLMPEVLGVPEEKFIWLRNSGNIIFDPFSSMTRTLAMACAVKQGREIVIIGHTDCLVRKTSTMDLTERFRALGVDRMRLPENLTEFFGLFASERQNVLRGCQIVRSSPLIGPKIPVHGLMVDLENGKLEWIVNGYEELAIASISTPLDALGSSGQVGAAIGSGSSSPGFSLGEMKFPDMKIGGPDMSIGGASTGLPEHKPVETRLPDFQPITPVTPTPVTPTPVVQPAQPHEERGIRRHLDSIGGFAHKVERAVEEVREARKDFQEVKADISRKAREIKQAGSTLDRIEKLAEVVQETAKSEKISNLVGNLDLIAKLGPVVAKGFKFNLIGHDHKRYGPVSGEKLIQWITDGRVDANTPVQVEGTQNWQPISLLPEALHHLKFSRKK